MRWIRAVTPQPAARLARIATGSPDPLTTAASASRTMADLDAALEPAAEIGQGGHRHADGGRHPGHRKRQVEVRGARRRAAAPRSDPSSSNSTRQLTHDTSPGQADVPDGRPPAGHQGQSGDQHDDPDRGRPTRWSRPTTECRRVGMPWWWRWRARRSESALVNSQHSEARRWRRAPSRNGVSPPPPGLTVADRGERRWTATDGCSGSSTEHLARSAGPVSPASRAVERGVPNEKIPPSEATSQYPSPRLRCGHAHHRTDQVERCAVEP